MKSLKALIWALPLTLTLCACSNDEETIVRKPRTIVMQVVTGDAQESYLTSATVQGSINVTIKNGIEVGMAYHFANDSSNINYAAASDNSGGYYGSRSFAVTLSGLQPDTEYAYFAYAKDAEGKLVVANEKKTFRTMSPEELLSSSSIQHVAIHDATACWTITDEDIYNELNDKSMNISLWVAWSSQKEDLTPTGTTFAANTKELTFNIGQSAFAKLVALKPSTCYYYIMYVNHNGKLYEGEVNTFVTLDETTTFGQTPDNVQAIDMGLPSGTKWANMNLGAARPTDTGLYYAWGETEGYNAEGSDNHLFSWSYYKWCKGTRSTMTKYCTNRAYGTLDNKAVLELADDAAYMNWGGEWRIPTSDEMQELIDNTVSEWTMQNSVEGYQFTSPKTGNSIFFPAVGCRVSESNYENGTDCYYWLSSVDQTYPYAASYLRFYVGRVFLASLFRYYGMNVRPVKR